MAPWWNKWLRRSEGEGVGGKIISIQGDMIGERLKGTHTHHHLADKICIVITSLSLYNYMIDTY